MKKEYTNGEVTVTWEPDVCIHSKRCWQGLLQVFNPQNRPWINMDGASTNRIIEQVKQCPSGALGFYMNDAAEQEDTASLIEITPSKNGPLMIKGDFKLVGEDGTSRACKGRTALCRCGHSGNKPFCDGSHSKNDFQD
ncbi:MAG: (4Fe-4S)-binding protein [Saprospiraceae bacterium]|nr:(4Fe-4S)-binding protein [Saprospiraceae bacterium]